MSDIKIFRLASGGVSEIEGYSVAIEKSLQKLIEQYLDIFLGVRFLATEYLTGKTHGGRIDTLGLDENGSPVIIEYKRALNENVINQGLFYLDWLLDHKAEFELLVLKKYGQHTADSIDWSSPRLLCIAGDFTKYDQYAVQQINRNIELIRYLRYGDELLLFELVNATTSEQTNNTLKITNISKPTTSSSQPVKVKNDVADRFEALKAFLFALGDDVQMKALKDYIAFKRLKNFACVELHTREMLVFVKVNLDTVQLQDGFTRDVRKIGHWGTGDLEIRIRTDDDLERAKSLILKSYESN